MSEKRVFATTPPRAEVFEVGHYKRCSLCGVTVAVTRPKTYLHDPGPLGGGSRPARDINKRTKTCPFCGSRDSWQVVT